MATKEEAAFAMVDQLNKAVAAIFEHCGYIEDWRVIPLSDNREFFWQVDPSEARKCRWSETVEKLKDVEGEHYYEGSIYTQRHLPKWVYRGEVLTLVCVDTHCDGNILLMIFRNDHEVKGWDGQ